MQWEFIVALVLAIPIIFFPAAFIWYMNIKGAQEAISLKAREQQTRRAESLRKARASKLATTGWDYIDSYLKPPIKE